MAFPDAPGDRSPDIISERQTAETGNSERVQLRFLACFAVLRPLGLESRSASQAGPRARPIWDESKVMRRGISAKQRVVSRCPLGSGGWRWRVARPYPDEFCWWGQVEGRGRRVKGRRGQRLRVSAATAVRWGGAEEADGPGGARGSWRAGRAPPLEAQAGLAAGAGRGGARSGTLDQIVVRLAEALPVKTSRSAVDRFLPSSRDQLSKKPCRRPSRCGADVAGRASCGERPSRASTLRS